MKTLRTLIGLLLLACVSSAWGTTYYENCTCDPGDSSPGSDVQGILVRHANAHIGDIVQIMDSTVENGRHYYVNWKKGSNAWTADSSGYSAQASTGGGGGTTGGGATGGFPGGGGGYGFTCYLGTQQISCDQWSGTG